MKTITKAVGMVEATETEAPNGSFEVILSAATLDRDGEIVDSKAFDPLPAHITFDIDHGMTVQTTVGSGEPFYDEDGALRVKGTYASTALAQEVRALVAEGHIRTTSVTFMAAERETDAKGVPHVTTAELLNGTFCPIPSNRESVVLSSKSLQAVTDEKVGARNSSTDAATIQDVHDSSVSLGASCDSEKSAGKSVTQAVRKAIAESYEEAERVVYDAVTAAYDDYDDQQYAYVVATFADSVVFRVSGGDSAGTWRASYTHTDDGTVTLGTPEKVIVTEVVTTVSGSDSSADTAAEAAAPEGAAASAAKSADESEVDGRPDMSGSAWLKVHTAFL